MVKQESNSGVLKPAKNEQAFLKAGFVGFEKSGKTYTASLLAMGLHKFLGSKKPVAFLDTETGSSYVVDDFKAAGIQLLTAKSRAFVDLIKVVNESERLCDILIIDSISHFWTELVEAYLSKMDRKRLRIQDWGPIKQEWHQFSDAYVNTKLHIIMCGRAGWTYDFKEDEDGVSEVHKTGTKMKAETETGFEPSLLVEMERIKANDGSIGQFLKHRAWIIGDRTRQLDGKCFDNPTFETFLPHLKKLNIGGDHVGIDTDKSSKDLFDSPSSASHEFKRREIFLQELKQELQLRFPGRSDADKANVIKILRSIYGTAAETALEEIRADVLGAGLARLKAFPADAPAGLVIDTITQEKEKVNAGKN